jgi:hypothetical protein
MLSWPGPHTASPPSKMRNNVVFTK